MLADHVDRSGAADDFGHLVRSHPLAVLRPDSVTDVAVAVRHCHERGIPVAARGAGHSTYGQAQVDSGHVVDMSALRSVRLGADSVVVEAGAHWGEVLHKTLAHGLTPPVLTDYLEVSVGGTLAVGGVGGTSHRHGAQVDNILKLEVVTGTGERTVCSPARRQDLFGAVLAGLGQCAIVVRAALPLLPAPVSVRRYTLRYPTVRALTADQRHVVRDGRFDFVQGRAELTPDGRGAWRYRLEAVAYVDGPSPPDDQALVGDLRHERGDEEIDDISYLDFLDRLAGGVADLRSTGEWGHPHPWWNAFLPDAAVDSFVSRAMAELTLHDIGPSGTVLLYPVRRPSPCAPLLRTPGQAPVFLFALLKTSSPGGDALPPGEMLDANRVLYEEARALGGTQYPVGSIPMSRPDWRLHFGRAWPAMAAAKRRYDPGNILTPGQRVFR